MATAADLIAFRARFDLTQEHLARTLGVPGSSLACWERGEHPVPKVVGLAFAWISTCYHEIAEELGQGRMSVGA